LIEGVAAVHRRRGGWSGVRWAPELGPTLLLGRSSLRSGVGVGDGRPWTAAPGEPPLCVAVDTPAPARGSPARLPESRPRPRPRRCWRLAGAAVGDPPAPAPAPLLEARLSETRPRPRRCWRLAGAAVGDPPAPAPLLRQGTTGVHRRRCCLEAEAGGRDGCASRGRAVQEGETRAGSGAAARGFSCWCFTRLCSCTRCCWALALSGKKAATDLVDGSVFFDLGEKTAGSHMPGRRVPHARRR
jgi:hypothetical protein